MDGKLYRTKIMPRGGYLKIILGCMYSGKTSKLISIYKHNKIAGIPTCVINYADDTRYDKYQMSTHDKMMIPCIRVRSVSDILSKEYVGFQTYLINEGQFFDDLYESVRLLVNEHHKTVYIAGLDGDYQMKKFGQLLSLIPLCNEVEKLNAICVVCKNKAAFTRRITNHKLQTVIGGRESYIPTCRTCHGIPLAQISEEIDKWEKIGDVK